MGESCGIGPAAPAALRPESERPAALHRYDLLLAARDEVVRAAGSAPADPEADAADLVAGAIPFAPGAPAALFRAESFGRSPPGEPGEREQAPAGECTLVARPPRAEYAGLVERVVGTLRAEREADGSLKKVVLARRLDVLWREPIDVARLAARLRHDRHVTTLLLRMRDGRDAPARSIVGATPEVLVEKRGAAVWSVPIAGSAARSRVRSADEAAARELLRSRKDREEHRLVVEYVLDTLSPLCVSVSATPAPTLSRTASMWHLATRVEGRLRDPNTPSLTLARRLHPTPAVCGVPSSKSARLISELEPFDRGFYGGTVGWSDGTGDGRWVITIRCADVSGSRASLFAGAGILPDSDPEAECAETSDKFRTLLSAFGIAEEGAVPRAPGR